MNAARAILQDLKPRFEAALLAGLKAVAAKDHEQLSSFHIRRSLEEQYNLVNSKDCCYDRPGTGFAYASWYHARRFHEAVQRFLPLLGPAPKSLAILDLGAGTGATAWAVAAAMIASREIDAAVPETAEIFAIDTSPSMTAASMLLWESLVAEFPSVADCVATTQHTRAWIQPPPMPKNAWIHAGHLFDASADLDETRQQLRRVVSRVEPSSVLLAGPFGKRDLLQGALAGAEDAGWQAVPFATEPQIWEGDLIALRGHRRAHFSRHGASATSVSRPPSWVGLDRVINARLVRGTAGDQLFRLGPSGLVLDDDQDEIAIPNDRFEVLVGSAGSGKSIVLVERIVRTAIEYSKTVGAPRMLVTTWNIAMTERLASWTSQRLAEDGISLEPQRGDEGARLLKWNDANRAATIQFFNWDKVATRVFHADTSGAADSDAIKVRVECRRKEGWPPLDAYPEYLDNPEWLVAELRRVIYGRRVASLEEYLAEKRSGRRKTLPPQIKKHVWSLLMETPVKQGSFTYRWIGLARRLKAKLDEPRTDQPGLSFPSFTHVFADEMQDFTAADFEFWAAMVPDSNRLFCVGDAAQAMLLSTSFDIPGLLAGRRRDVRQLTHSYRMSRRIAEAVQPLATQIEASAAATQRQWVGIPRGTRSGVLGVRPIVMNRNTDLAQNLKGVLEAFSDVFRTQDEPTLTVAEGQRAKAMVENIRRLVSDAYGANAPRVLSESMAKIKGLERTCVVWATSKKWDLDESAAQFVHTVLTRATDLVIIVHDVDDTPADIKDALRQLDVDRLLFWDAAAEQQWPRR